MVGHFVAPVYVVALDPATQNETAQDTLTETEISGQGDCCSLAKASNKHLGSEVQRYDFLLDYVYHFKLNAYDLCLVKGLEQKTFVKAIYTTSGRLKIKNVEPRSHLLAAISGYRTLFGRR